MKLLRSFIIFGVVLVLMCVPVSAAVVTDQPAPDFKLQDTTEQWHNLSDFRGKYVILEWINFDCPFVKKHYGSGNMQSLQKKFTAEGVAWLTINSSAPGNQGHYHPDDVNRMLKEKGASPTAYLMDFDGVVGRMYAAKATPHMFIIDPQGIVIYQGAIDSVPSASPGDIATAANYVSQALNDARAGIVVRAKTTQPYGCSVKY